MFCACKQQNFYTWFIRVKCNSLRLSSLKKYQNLMSWLCICAKKFFCMLFVILLFFVNFFFQNKPYFSQILSGTWSECQIVWIQITTDVLLVLIWVQTICKVASSQEKCHVYCCCFFFRIFFLHPHLQPCLWHWEVKAHARLCICTDSPESLHGHIYNHATTKLAQK